MALKIVDENDPQSDAEIEQDLLDQYAWRDRRRRVNDEQALDDMLGRGTPPDVPRATHLPIRHREPSSGEFLLLIGCLIGSLFVIGLLLASWPELPRVAACTP